MAIHAGARTYIRASRAPEAQLDLAPGNPGKGLGRPDLDTTSEQAARKLELQLVTVLGDRSERMNQLRPGGIGVHGLVGYPDFMGGRSGRHLRYIQQDARQLRRCTQIA